MTSPRYLSPTCVVLPSADYYLVVEAAKQRAVRLSPPIGQWLAQGGGGGAPPLQPTDWEVLERVGILQTGKPRFGLRTWFAHPVARILAILLLICVALFGFLTKGALIIPALRLQATSPVLWLSLLPCFLVQLLFHESGHILALAMLGGRAGPLQIQRQWPWVILQVGPYRAHLAPLKAIFLAGAGPIMDLIVLGIAAALLHLPVPPALPTALILMATISLLLNMLPSPWSDGGQIILVARRIPSDLGGTADD
jgi:hypothetical protein